MESETCFIFWVSGACILVMFRFQRNVTVFMCLFSSFLNLCYLLEKNRIRRKEM